MIFLLSLKYGHGGWTRRDIFAFVLAFLGIGIWFVTRDAIYALIITIFVDAIGATLTALKAAEHPESETVSTWVLSGISGLLGTAAVGNWNPVLMVYPFYVFVANSAVLMGIFIGYSRKNKKRAKRK